MIINSNIKFKTDLSYQEFQKRLVKTLSSLGKEGIFVTGLNIDDKQDVSIENDIKISEGCLVLIKPGFSRNEELRQDVLNEINNLGLKIVKKGYKKYTKAQAKIHYINKKSAPYYDELAEYLSSDVVYGIIVSGIDSIDKVSEKIHELRKTLPQKFKLKPDVMRNVLHSTRKDVVNGLFKDVDSQREISVFLNAESIEI